MLFVTATLLVLALGVSGHGHSGFDAMPPNPVPSMHVEKEMKLPDDYFKMRHHTILSRDHGCVDLEEKVDEAHACATIWLRNRFSDVDIAPNQVLTEFQYHGTHDSWKPAVTWVEHVGAKYVRACAATVPGDKGVLSKGKIRWIALYNHTQTSSEQSGTIRLLDQNMNHNLPFTANKHCFHVNFPLAFSAAPAVKFTLKLKGGYKSGEDAMVIWAKGVTTTSAYVCLEEFHAWARYHTNYELYWYGVVTAHNQDSFNEIKILNFPANQAMPAQHDQLLTYFCQNATMRAPCYPCPGIVVQVVEPSLQTCESPLTAWVSYMSGADITVCYGDKRGISNQRLADVQVHMIVYGFEDPCNNVVCPAGQSHIRPTFDTCACGCPTTCSVTGGEVCASNGLTYPNRCELEKFCCANGCTYAHKGACEKFTYDHGRSPLAAVSSCDGLYCADISTRNNIWYEHAKINVQVSVNWANMMSEPHSASTSWVENVKPTGFRACVMQAGRQTLATPPMINWFAYQGQMDEVMSHKIEVGEWHSGTHCVPVHERKDLDHQSPFMPDVCPQIKLEDIGKVDKSKWRYDAHLMSQVYGQHHHEWFKRMLMGYGVKKMNLSSGMEIMGATLMMTVEHTKATNSDQNKRDSVNVWMEYDEKKKEAYVCLRELQNFDGKHEGIHVHWTLFNNTMIRNLGFSHKVSFKPSMESTMMGSMAKCQTKKYLPDDMDLVDSATALVSVTHKIKPYSAMDSMKRYHLHHQEMKMGMSIGEADMNKKEVRESWMFPHMWRANLTGWRPHMRINKDSDYSAWIEGMNNTHITVCEQSLYADHHHQGVDVNIFILPDRCPSNYRLFKNGVCGRFMSTCQSVSQAQQSCANEGAVLGAPEDCRDAVWSSYMAGQATIHVAKSDAANEGQWVRAYGNPSTSTYFNWAIGQPSAQTVDYDCAAQRGRAGEFTEHDQLCSTCLPYVCIKSAPWLSCGFRKPSYCNDCGNCMRTGVNTHQCDCIPPYSGARCEFRRPEADQ